MALPLRPPRLALRRRSLQRAAGRLMCDHGAARAAALPPVGAAVGARSGRIGRGDGGGCRGRRPPADPPADLRLRLRADRPTLLEQRDPGPPTLGLAPRGETNRPLRRARRAGRGCRPLVRLVALRQSVSNRLRGSERAGLHVSRGQGHLRAAAQPRGWIVRLRAGADHGAIWLPKFLEALAPGVRPCDGGRRAAGAVLCGLVVVGRRRQLGPALSGPDPAVADDRAWLPPGARVGTDRTLGDRQHQRGRPAARPARLVHELVRTNRDGPGTSRQSARLWLMRREFDARRPAPEGDHGLRLALFAPDRPAPAAAAGRCPSGLGADRLADAGAPARDRRLRLVSVAARREGGGQPGSHHTGGVAGQGRPPTLPIQPDVTTWTGACRTGSLAG